MGKLRDLPGKLHAGRSCADDDERQPGSANFGIGLALGELEGAEDPPAQLQRVVDRLHARRVPRELRVSEVRLLRAGGDNQAVIGDVAAPTERVDHQAPGLRVDPHNLAEDDRGVPLVPQDVADRRRDVALGQDAGRHLIEQRLEQVMVGAVDDCHIDMCAPKRLSGEQPGEPGADDHDTMRRIASAWHLQTHDLLLSVTSHTAACGARRSVRVRDSRARSPSLRALGSPPTQQRATFRHRRGAA